MSQNLTIKISTISIHEPTQGGFKKKKLIAKFREEEEKKPQNSNENHIAISNPKLFSEKGQKKSERRKTF